MLRGGGLIYWLRARSRGRESECDSKKESINGQECGFWILR